MTPSEIEFAKTIISGVNFLMAEAENAGNHTIARIMKICLKDICRCLENDAQEQGDTDFILDSDLFAAICFVTKFASIKDEELRKDVLQKIEGVKNMFQVKGH